MHIEKFKANQVGQLVAHCNRKNYQTREFSNENIDKTKTHLNYNLCNDHSDLKEIDFINKRVDESKHMNRSDIVKMCSVCLTLPADFDGDQRLFFKNSYDFLKNRYGENNVISSYVHLDEKTPHMHFLFVPVDRDNKLCCKNIITRQDLKTLHTDLEKYLRKKDPAHTINLINEKTRSGNKSVVELKRDSYYDEFNKFSEKYNQILDLEERVQDLLKQEKDLKNDLEERSKRKFFDFDKSKYEKNSLITELDEYKQKCIDLERHSIYIENQCNELKEQLDERSLSRQIEKTKQIELQKDYEKLKLQLEQYRRIFSDVEKLEKRIQDIKKYKEQQKRRDDRDFR